MSSEVLYRRGDLEVTGSMAFTFASDEERDEFIRAAEEDLAAIEASIADDSPRPELDNPLRSRSVRPSNTNQPFVAGELMTGADLRAHEERVRQFLAEAEVRDGEKSAELVRRYPSRPERSLRRPRTVKHNGVQREVHDLSLDFTGDVLVADGHVYREWLAQQFSDF